MKNTTVEYTDEPIQIGKVVHDLFPKDAKFNFEETEKNSKQSFDVTDQVNLTFNKKLLEQLKHEAASQKISVSTLVEQLVVQGLNQLQANHVKTP